MLEWYKRTRRYCTVVSELNSLSDKELSDIGLYRGDIVFVAIEMSLKPTV